MSDKPRGEARSALIHVRVKPILRDRIEQQARAEGVNASAVVRKVLAAHFSKK